MLNGQILYKNLVTLVLGKLHRSFSQTMLNEIWLVRSVATYLRTMRSWLLENGFAYSLREREGERVREREIRRVIGREGVSAKMEVEKSRLLTNMEEPPCCQQPNVSGSNPSKSKIKVRFISGRSRYY